MARIARRSGIIFTLLALMSLLQLVGASSASAATTCRHYDGFRGDAGLLRNINLCAAPASDFPGYTGWGRVVRQYSTHPDVCGFSLFPYDIDEPQPLIACVAMLPPPVATWRWTGSGWIRGGALHPGDKAYFAPYAAGWRWAWTQRTGWVALDTRHAAFRWST